MKGKKGWRSLIMFCLVLISLFVLVQKYNIQEIAISLRHFKPQYLLLAVGTMGLFFLFEALALHHLFGVFGFDSCLRRCYGYSLIDYFFSSLTPGGSGGQPSQLYYMHRDELPVGVSGMTLLLFNMIYHVAMLLMAAVAFFMGATRFVSSVGILRWLILYGAVAQMVFVIAFLGLTCSGRIVPHMLFRLVEILSHWGWLRDPMRWQEKIRRQSEEYRNCAGVIRRRPLTLIYLLFLSILLLSCSYGIPYFVYRGLGFHEIGWFEMVMVQSVIILAMESLPLPGGVGVSEGSLLAVYALLIGRAQAFPMMLLSRALSFYLGFASGGVASFVMEKNPRRIRRKKVIPTT